MPCLAAEEAAVAAAEAEPADTAAEVAEQQGLYAYRLAVVSRRPRVGVQVPQGLRCCMQHASI